MTINELKKEIKIIVEDVWYRYDIGRGDILQACYEVAALTADMMVGEFENRRTAIEGVVYEDNPTSLGYNLRVSEEHQLAREIKKLSE